MQIAKTKKLRVTKDVKETMSLLKTALGASRYAISAVPKSHRRSNWDFIAADKDAPRKFIRVRPTYTGRVSVTAFNLPIKYSRARMRIEEMRFRVPAKIVWSSKQLRFHPEQSYWWKSYFRPKDLERFGLTSL